MTATPVAAPPASEIDPLLDPLLEPSGQQVHVPAGTYYLGDISQLLDDATWDLIHARCDADAYDASGLIGATLRGRHVVVMTAMNGEGTYTGVDGHEYATHSGSLGLLATSLADTDKTAGKHGCRMVAFSALTQCSRDAAGTLRFGRHAIDTDDTQPETQQCTWCSEDLDEYGYCPTGCGPDGPGE